MPAMVWSGWGDPARRHGLPAHAAAFLQRELGWKDRATPPIALAEVRLRSPALPAVLAGRLAEIVGAAHLRDDRESRVLHAGGKSYPDLMRRRTGDAEAAPDAVVSPAGHEQVMAVLRACAEAGVAVVPFGGGTSVVGGVEPLRGRFPAVIALDLSRMTRLLSVDPLSLTATLEPGLRGVQAEALLAARGLTLGHFPQSYEHASIGGYVATRSAGQASTGYGRIDELVLGVRLATPEGELVLGHGPASAAGPDLKALVVGSEGTLGVITEVSLRVHRQPERRRYEGWFFRNWEEGTAAFRRLVQEGAAPDLCRLSDADETRTNLALAGLSGLKGRALAGYLQLRGYAGGCLAIVGWEGTAAAVRARRRASAQLLRGAGGLGLGQRIGRAWEQGRYSGPYLRDDLMDHGVLVETVETAASWSRLQPVYGAVRAALQGALAKRGTPPLVLCHVSHLYPTGASLYFTFLASAEPGRELEQWRAAKLAACEAIVGSGATITHHHGVGADHAPYYPAEVGALGIAAVRAVKERLDPKGILNPGKLLP